MFYSIAKFILKLFVTFYNRLTVHNKENIPRKGPMIIVANHVSFLDPIYLGLAMPEKLNFMAKKESFRNKFFSILLRSLGAFPVDREKADVGAIKTSLRLLKGGKALVIFPQGGRRDDLNEEDIKQGAAYFAVKTNAIILPVYIKGTDQVMPKGQKLIKPKKVDIYIGQAIEMNSYSEHDVKNLMTKVTESILTSLHKINEQADK